MTFDPGLQPQRTGLSWHRVVLSLVGLGFIAIKLALFSGQQAMLCVAIGCFAAAMIGCVTSAWQSRRLVSPTPRAMEGATVQAVVVVVALLCVASFAMLGLALNFAG